MTRAEIERMFPKLKPNRYEITSPFDENYNCIAFAAGDVNQWWWPADPGDAYWPPDAPRWETMSGFARAIETRGYVRCSDGQLESGFQKIALYADAREVPTHAARQLPDGIWTSKLGKCEDIRHDEVDGLEDSIYGHVAVYMKRPMTQEA